MKKLLLAILGIVIVGGIAFFVMTNDTKEATAPNIDTPSSEESETSESTESVSVTPVSHATMMLTWRNEAIYVDPVGGADAFAELPDPSLILVTDIHGDHLDTATLQAVITDRTTLVAPQAVVDELPESLANRATVMANGDTIAYGDLSITAVPMYNLPDQGVEIRHPKGRGNGYIIEQNGYDVYIAGDTADIPEMRALESIEMAFIPMNMPYTMTVEDAADGVLAFSPTRVFPYHYRGQDGLSDVERFKSLVESQSDATEVILLNWYPGQ